MLFVQIVVTVTRINLIAPVTNFSMVLDLSNSSEFYVVIVISAALPYGDQDLCMSCVMLSSCIEHPHLLLVTHGNNVNLYLVFSVLMFHSFLFFFFGGGGGEC
jgi:hypothetical protein